MKQIVLLVFSLLAIETSFSQITLIPDANFEQVLVNQGKDYDGIVNGQMATSDAIGVYYLDVSNANISDLTGIEAFVNLTDLNAPQNNISVIDLSQNTALTSVNLTSNQLTDFNFPQLTQLSELTLQYNPITTIDISSNTTLSVISFSNTDITSLDLTQNVNLTTASISNTLLESIDIRSGNNAGINYFYAISNPNLTCIFVDDASDSYLSNWTIGSAQFVNNQVECDALQNPLLIPDPNFEQALIDLGIDTDNSLNGQMSTLNALTVSYLNINNKNISDLTGIEGFTGLTELNASGNNLSTIDISSNINLTVLNLSENNLTNLDVSNNPELIILNCTNNQLLSIDVSMLSNLSNLNLGFNQLNSIDVTSNEQLKFLNLSDNTLNGLNLSTNLRLTNLVCQNCNLSSLDVSYNDSLVTLNCYNNLLTIINVDNLTLLESLSLGLNQLSQIDLTNNIQLEILSCDGNQLSALDVSGLVNLNSLYASDNNISSLDVSTNTLLDNLSCENNSITVLDLTNNSLLTGINASHNSLNSVDLRNANNANISSISLLNNPDLTCLFVDDKNASFLSSWNIDGSTNFVETNADCLALSGILNIPDNNFEQELIDLGIDTDGLINQQIDIVNTTGVLALDLQGLNISDLTGIEGFLDLETLNCSNNTIDSLNLSSNSNLVILNASSNTLTFLDLRNGNNQNMSTVDFTTNDNLNCVFVDDKDATILTTWNESQNSSYVNNEVQCLSLGIDELENRISLYPNPVNNLLTITVQESTTFEIISLDGKTILSGSLTVGSNSLDLTIIPVGLYILKTELNSSIKVVKN